MANRRGLLEHENIAWDDSADARKTIGVDPNGDAWAATNPFPVTTVSSIAKLTFLEYQSVTAVPVSTETTVLSFTNSTGSDLRLKSINVEGIGRAEWKIFINTVLKLKVRTSTTTPSLQIDLGEFKMASSDIIDVKVIHYANSAGDFSSTVNYFK